MNDSWCLNIDKQPFFWTKLDCKGDIPAPRVYHSADVCQSGAAAGMIVIFGGRRGDKSDQNSKQFRIINLNSKNRRVLGLPRTSKTQGREVGLGKGALFGFGQQAENKVST